MLRHCFYPVARSRRENAAKEAADRMKAALSILVAVLFAHTPLAKTQTPPANLPANLVTVDATSPVSPPETGYLHLGGVSSNGHSLQVNSRYLVRDGKPWLPVMGEIHYTRIPESQWEDEILKMQTAGIDIIATYVFWIHHEEVEGQFDWTGRRDLRHFVELCAKHHMYVWLRPGPWAHGEVRNGGFPDWLVKLPNTRTNDPVYIRHVTSFFDQIGEQLHGLMFKDGGPIIGAQLENEYSLHGPGRGAEHILTLKQIAIAAGIVPPLFSVTGWPSLDFPPQEVIPVAGGYPDGFWFGSQHNLPPSITYLFNFNRELGDMGATVKSEDPTGKVNLAHDPYLAAEEGGGMATAYHRRPVLSSDDIAALTLTGIGSGINLYGYYMFHGGTNPKGVLSTLQESQATGFPNDLPQLDYDFQAPLGAFGQERESYRKTRMMHLFLNAYGEELAPMAAYAPMLYSRDPADTSTPRVAVRTDQRSGFVFVNNYVRQLSMPARPGFQVKMRLPGGKIAVPSKPIDLPANAYFAWPFNLALGKASLRYSTAQLLTRLTTPSGPMVVFFAIPGIAPEFAFESGLGTISAPGAKTSVTATSVNVTGLAPGPDAIIRLTDVDGGMTTILLLTKDQAEHTALLHIGSSDHLVTSASSILSDGKRIRLRSTASRTQKLALLPAVHLDSGTAKTNGLWTTYTFTQPEQHPALAMKETQTATARAAVDMGPYVDWRNGGVATVSPDAAFARAETWTLGWKALASSGLSQVLLRIDYTGDIARLTSGSTLVDDNFYNGLPWEVGFQPAAAESLKLQILPLPAARPIYLDPSLGKPSPLKVELIPEYEATATADH